jgi:hypothetical protein
MVTIGIDQSLSGTGITILDNNKEPKHFLISPDKIVGVKRLDYICRNLIEIIANGIVENDGEQIVICREDYAYAAIGDVFSLGELGGCIDLSIYRALNPNGESPVTYYCMPSNSWKLLILGAGSLKKDTGYLLNIFNKTGLKFENDNIADSHMLALAILKMLDIPDGLTIKQKMGVISSKLRKKRKITEGKIKDVADEELKELAKLTMKEYLIFDYAGKGVFK